MATKVCFKCLKRKPLSRFYAHPMMRDGHLGKCKACTKHDVKQRAPEKLREYEARRSQDPARKAQQTRQTAQHRKLFPGRYKARTAVGNALRAGRLKKGVCSECGTQDGVEAHHDDYRKPLDVRWLCRKCHRSHHKGHSNETTNR